MRRIANGMFLICIILIGSCQLGRQGRPSFSTLSFTEMWRIDSCGVLGYRKAIADYLFSNEERMRLFNGSSQHSIISIFPFPNEMKLDLENRYIYITYITEGYFGVCQLPNEAVLETMYFVVDEKTKKVIDSGWSIY